MRRTITVKVPAHRDPALAGKARVRKPWAKERFFTEEPETVTYDPAIARMLLRGDLVEVEPPRTKRSREE